MPKALAEADLYFNACSKIELHQRIDGFIRRLDDVQYTLMYEFRTDHAHLC